MGGRRSGRKNPGRFPAAIVLSTSPIAGVPPPRSSATNAGRTTPLGPASAAFTIANTRIVIHNHGTGAVYRHPSRTSTMTDGFRSLGRGVETPPRADQRSVALTANDTASNANAVVVPPTAISRAPRAGPPINARVRVPWYTLFAACRSAFGTVSGRNALRAGIANA